MQKVLLIGNGINRLEQGKISWGDVLVELAKLVSNTKGEIDLEGKPFPLFYEEIYLIGRERNRFKDEEDLKERTVELIDQIRPTSMHPRLFGLDIDAILTTNFDYTIEQSIGDNSLRNGRSETRYSLFRRSTVDKLNLWHIHGELNMSSSIMLGYAHYVDYLGIIKDYFQYTGRTGPVKAKPSLESRVLKKQHEIFSWVDHFFFSHVHIVGMGMDYTELHLWWLLNTRARLSLIDPSLVENRIDYFYPAFEPSSPSKIGKLELLDANGVDLVEIECADYDAFYEAVFERLQA